MKNECIYTDQTLPLFMKKSLIDNFFSLPLSYKKMVEKNCTEWITEIQSTGKLVLGKFNSIEDKIPYNYPRKIIENPEDSYLINFQRDESELFFRLATFLDNYSTLDYKIISEVRSELRRIIHLPTFYLSDMKTFMKVSQDLIDYGQVYSYIEIVRKSISDFIFNYILPVKVKAYSLSIQLETDCRPADDLVYLISHSSLSITLQWMRSILNYDGYQSPKEIHMVITKFSVGIILFCKLLELDPLKYQHVFTAWTRFGTSIEKELKMILRNKVDLIELLGVISTSSENVEEIELFRQSIRQLEMEEKNVVKDKNSLVLFFPSYNKLSYEDFDNLILLIRSIDKGVIMKYVKTPKVTFQLSEQDLMFLRKEYADTSDIAILNDSMNTITDAIIKYLFVTSEFNQNDDKSEFFLLFKILPDKICGIEVTGDDCKKIIAIDKDPNFDYALHENIFINKDGDTIDNI